MQKLKVEISEGISISSHFKKPNEISVYQLFCYQKTSHLNSTEQYEDWDDIENTLRFIHL